MKVLIINGSPRQNGNCSYIVKELEETLNKHDVEAIKYQLGSKNIRGCMACGYCYSNGHCVFNDDVVELNKIFEEADGLIVISPVYYGSPNGSIISLLDRMFYSKNFSVKYKVGAAFAVARRAGTVASFDVLNKYFTISGMPLVSGDYWNNGFGREQGQIVEDKEGLRNARIIAQRMVFLMKAIKDSKGNYPDLLEEEDRIFTHFIK